MLENARQLAEYAAVAQAAGLVPLVEPEILIDGGHGVERSGDVGRRVLAELVAALHRQPGLAWGGTLLKLQMIMPGADCPARAGPDEIAAHTLRVLRCTVPPAVPGVAFLSGGQTEEQATVNLHTINRAAAESGGAPWALTFSFGRALQASVLSVWGGKAKNSSAARAMAERLAAANAAARRGEYVGPHPSVLAGRGNLRETFRGHTAN